MFQPGPLSLQGGQPSTEKGTGQVKDKELTLLLPSWVILASHLTSLRNILRHQCGRPVTLSCVRNMVLLTFYIGDTVNAHQINERVKV